MTLPAGIGRRVSAARLEPTLQVLGRELLRAWASGMFCTPGTTVLPGPEDTVSVTVEPWSSLTPGCGD